MILSSCGHPVALEASPGTEPSPFSSLKCLQWLDFAGFCLITHVGLSLALILGYNLA
jgi:hypothetical protein